MNKENQLEYVKLKDVLSYLYRYKLAFVAFILLVVSIAFAFALSLPDMYKSEATLVPTGAIAGSGGGIKIGGIAASLAGVNLGASSGNKLTVALETMKSRVFVREFLDSNDFYDELFAIKGWDLDKKQAVYDLDLYNPKTAEWKYDKKQQKSLKPSFITAYHEFIDNLVISQSNDNQILQLSYMHASPYIAKLWLETLIDMINRHLRLQAIAESNQRLEYLNNQLRNTPITEVREVFYGLIEKETKEAMLAKVQPEYAFKIIDPPLVAESRSSPNRRLIVMVAVVLSGVVCFCFALVAVIWIKVD